MTHDEEITNLDRQIRLELEREKSLANKPPLKFRTPSDLLTFLNRLPINRKVELTALSPFLRRFRKNVSLDLQDVVTATNVPRETVLLFESGDVPPWTLPSSMMVRLAVAYRIHIEAIDFLTRNSFQLALLSKAIEDPEKASASISQWLKAVRSEMKARGETALTS
jgi:hypothetical protein